MDSRIEKITTADLDAERIDRFHRLKLIPWWDQERLARARVLVVGAGALGNEIIKNLALLGVGNVFIADMDVIENSNLSRSILFRESDCGKPKAESAAEAARGIFPGMRTRAFRGNAIYGLGLGVFGWADVVIGGLDNREARLEMNRACRKMGKVYIDGAIEQLDGAARIFAPQGPCYECTMSERDWEILRRRRSCALLSREQMLEGKTPTTPTISSIIAGVQAQEAVKYLHGREIMAGKAFHFFGAANDCYWIALTEKPDCPSHDFFAEVMDTGMSARRLTPRMLLAKSLEILGESPVIELNHDILAHLNCGSCKIHQRMFCSLGAVSQSQALCPQCGKPRDAETISSIYGDEDFLDEPFVNLGIPLFDILTARAGERRIHWRLDGDAADALEGLEVGNRGNGKSGDGNAPCEKGDAP